MGDLIDLWRAIKETHIAFSTGNTMVVKQVQRQRYNELRMSIGETLVQLLRQRYHEMKMSIGETLVQLKFRFITALKAKKVLNMATPTDEDQAADFITNLDNRWSVVQTSGGSED